MSGDGLLCKASVDGLGKHGEVYTFLICLGAEFSQELHPGDSLIVSGVSVRICNFEDGYVSFELTREQLLGTPLVEVEVGSEVTVLRGAGGPPA